MKTPFLLSSAQNPKIKFLQSLKDKRDRDRTGLFIIEGYREISRAVSGSVKIHSLFICPHLFLGSNEPALIRDIQESGAEVFELPPELFEKISYRDRPDGLMAMGHQMRYRLEELAAPVPSAIYVVAEAIEKPGNLGTILRSSDAIGAKGVIVVDRCTDLYNPNVVRASVGTLFTVPAIETTSEQALQWLQEHRVKIVAATPAAQETFTHANLRGPIAIVLGTEQLGLTPFWMKQCDLQVKIPMKGVADSLNVAMATTLLLYEALRQNERP